MFETQVSSCRKFPLIINADDFGYSDAVNRAVIQAHREGILTSTSLMVNERAAEAAIRLARENPSLAVGLHLTLVLGRAALPHSEIPHITDAHGNFSRSNIAVGVKYFFSPAARRELRREMRAQFEKFAATGLPFSHVDGHTHLHLHPVIFDELLTLCEEFQVRRVRVVRDDLRLNLSISRSHLPLKLVWAMVFHLLARRCEKKMRGRNFIQPQRVYGLFQTGKVTEDFLLKLIPQMHNASSEIYAHPLAEDAEAWNKKENPGGCRELQSLVSENVRQEIIRAGFALSTYRALESFRNSQT
jgi:hopanoid biosynthesis associated protein HpnK